jgi:hypothetical protein
MFGAILAIMYGQIFSSYDSDLDDYFDYDDDD